MSSTTGSTGFTPDAFFESWANGAKKFPLEDDLKTSIKDNFDLADDDDYVYHANASITLDQAQRAIIREGADGLHAWYLDNNGAHLPSPTPADITAYTSIFAPNTSPSKILIGFAANAKKGSLRAKVASHLTARRVLPPTIALPKSKIHVNPYYDFWCWSCRNLEWAGPEENTVHVKMSHHILPIFMHHFGCVVPTYESLAVIREMAGKRPVMEIGSGNGYWAYMLRRLGVSVQAVDNLQSVYRTLWITDTVIADGVDYIKNRRGCKDCVLLLVYPIVGSGFSAKVLKAYKGDTICVAATQNRNGYTGFKDQMIDEYISVEKPEFQKTIQIPLASFPGKDDALFVFQRNTSADIQRGQSTITS